MSNDRSTWMVALTLCAGMLAAGSAPALPQETAIKGKLVRVEGNRFVDRAGKEVIFRGVATSEPAHLAKDGRWTPAYFAVIREWGANVVRVPLHPGPWRELGRDRYLALLDQAIDWAARNDMFVIVDWHIIGNPRTELAYNADYETAHKETLTFWRVVSDRYKDDPRVFLYEIYDEPTAWRGRLGEISWSEWRGRAEEIVKIIHAHDPQAIPIVPGLDWGFDLTGVASAPLAAPGIA